MQKLFSRRDPAFVMSWFCKRKSVKVVSVARLLCRRLLGMLIETIALECPLSAPHPPAGLVSGEENLTMWWCRMHFQLFGSVTSLGEDQQIFIQKTSISGLSYGICKMVTPSLPVLYKWKIWKIEIQSWIDANNSGIFLFIIGTGLIHNTSLTWIYDEKYVKKKEIERHLPG